MSGFKLLRLAHRDHTARRLEHHHTSYSALVLIGIVGAGLLFYCTQKTLQLPAADNLTVTANVAGTPPTIAPVITAPTDGQTFTTIPITVSGTCESGLITKIYKNNVFAGSTVCSGGGNFSLQIDLFVGQNILIARDYDFADQPSPDSAPVTVTYTPPSPPPSVGTTPPTPGSSGGSSGGTAAPVSQFTITSPVTYKGVITKSELSWPIEIHGGTAPFAVSWDWGDGHTDLISRAVAGSFNGGHTYDTPGNYTITIKGTDSAGATAFLQLAVIVSGEGAAHKPLISPGSLLVIWPLYGFVLILLIVFWLGTEREHRRVERELESADGASLGS